MTRYFGIHTLEGEWHSLLPRYALLSDRLQGKRVLDIGCGTGIGSSLLLEMGAEHVDAIDHRPAVLDLARVKHAKQGLDFHVMFWEELGFPDETFDMVLCLDPTSPVTDVNLLAEIKRVLKPGGEYVCAVERRNIEGVESLLPRYGYTDNAESVELNRSEDRVPQIGNLSESFETVVSVLQQPRYSYVFDFNTEPDGTGARPYTMRKASGAPDESGLWVGDAPREDSAENTDQRPGRWLGIDERLWSHEGDASNVELLFCGDAHMPPPTLREVRMPYAGLVDRLHGLISDLQIRQHPSQRDPSFGDVMESGGGFSERETTSEFKALNHWTLEKRSRRPGFEAAPRPYDFGHDAARTQADHERGLDQIRDQLEQMTYLYQQIRSDMEDLFVRTRSELTERDRYIEHLVDTVHRWQHHAYSEIDEPTGVYELPREEPGHGFEVETTGIFTKPLSFVKAEDQGDEASSGSGERASDGDVAACASELEIDSEAQSDAVSEAASESEDDASESGEYSLEEVSSEASLGEEAPETESAEPETSH